MSFQQELEAKKQELESLKLISSISISQVDHGRMGGKDAQFILSGLNSINTGVIVKYIQDNQAALLTLIKKQCRAEIEALRIKALEEANKFVQANSTPEVIL